MFSALASAVGNIAGGFLNDHRQREMNRFGFKLQKQGYKEFPTAQVKGLRAAGINPMVAYGSIGNATFNPNTSITESSAGSQAVSAFNDTRKTNTQTKLAGAQQQSFESQTDLNKANAKLANAQAKLIDVQAGKVGTETPGTTTWGTVDRVLDNVGSLGDLGTTGLGLKAVYDMWKKNNNIPKNDIPLPEKTPGIKKTPGIDMKNSPKSISTNAGNSAKVVKDVFSELGKFIAPIALVSAATYGGKKIEEITDKSKHGKKMKENHKSWNYLHGNWSR